MAQVSQGNASSFEFQSGHFKDFLQLWYLFLSFFSFENDWLTIWWYQNERRSWKYQSPTFDMPREPSAMTWLFTMARLTVIEGVIQGQHNTYFCLLSISYFSSCYFQYHKLTLRPWKRQFFTFFIIFLLKVKKNCQWWINEHEKY